MTDKRQEEMDRDFDEAWESLYRQAQARSLTPRPPVLISVEDAMEDWAQNVPLSPDQRLAFRAGWVAAMRAREKNDR